VVRLTTARYYTPSGRCIQKPYDDGTEDYYADLTKRFKHGEFVSADSIKFPDSIKYYTPSKRIVYGGGGIMPDVFIPIDTASNSKYYTDLFRKGLLNEYTIDYLDKHRAELNRKFPSLALYKADFEITDEMFDGFIAFAEKKEVPRDEEGLERSGYEIKTIIKGLIARNMFDVSAYFEVISPIDRELMQAIKSIQDDALFRKLSIAM
jgi:carboxyl-terminal processing protease